MRNYWVGPKTYLGNGSGIEILAKTQGEVDNLKYNKTKVIRSIKVLRPNI